MTTTITVRGVLAEDPEIRYRRDGTAAGSLTVIVDHKPLRVTVLGNLAENVCLSLSKGHRVVASGEYTGIARTRLADPAFGPSDHPVPAFLAEWVAADLADCTVDVHMTRPLRVPTPE